MELVAVVLQSLVAVTFLLAAIGKWRDVQGASVGAADLGVPQRFVPSVARVLPIVEAAVSIGLVVGRLADLALGAACILLAAFSVVVASNLARGLRPVCSCFGGTSSAPISAKTLVRNAALFLASLGALVVGDGRGSAVALAERLTASDVRVAAVVLGLVAVVQSALLFRSMTPSALAPPENSALAIGQLAPPFDLPDLSGDRHTLQTLVDPRVATLLVFVSPNCTACDALLPELEDWHRTLRSTCRIVVLTTGSVGSNREKFGDHAVEPVLLQPSDAVARAYHVPATPAAVLLSPDGRVSEHMAVGGAEIRHLVEHLRSDSLGPAADLQPLPIGAPAPVFRLPGVTGADVDLAEHRGRLTLLVNWSPTCIYCRELHPRLRAWEVEVDETSGPGLVVLSSGSIAANRGEGFPVMALDDGDLTRRAFGFVATPEALLIDAHGNVASQKVAGADAVMSLAHRSEALVAAAERLERRKIRPPASMTQQPGYHPGSGGTHLGE